MRFLSLFLVIFVHLLSAPVMAVSGPPEDSPKPSERPDRRGGCENTSAMPASKKMSPQELMLVASLSKLLRVTWEKRHNASGGVAAGMEDALQILPVGMQSQMRDLALQMPRGMVDAAFKKLPKNSRARYFYLGLRAFHRLHPESDLLASDNIQEVFAALITVEDFLSFSLESLNVFAMAPNEVEARAYASFMRIGTLAFADLILADPAKYKVSGWSEPMHHLYTNGFQKRAFALAMATLGDEVFFDEVKAQLLSSCSATSDDQLIERTSRGECTWSDEDLNLQYLFAYRSKKSEILDFQSRFLEALQSSDDVTANFVKLIAIQPIL